MKSNLVYFFIRGAYSNRFFETNLTILIYHLYIFLIIRFPLRNNNGEQAIFRSVNNAGKNNHREG